MTGRTALVPRPVYRPEDRPDREPFRPDTCAARITHLGLPHDLHWQCSGKPVRTEGGLGWCWRHRPETPEPDAAQVSADIGNLRALLAECREEIAALEIEAHQKQRHRIATLELLARIDAVLGKAKS